MGFWERLGGPGTRGFPADGTEQRIEERKKIVAEALTQEQRQRVAWLRNYARYAPAEEEREAAERKLEEEQEALAALERGEVDELLRGLAL
jgi:hypothetical protein